MKYAIVVFWEVLVAAVVGYGLGLAVSSSPGVSELPTERKLVVTASFYPLYYLVSVIGGDRTDVRNLVPAGVEPHDFEPTSQDIAKIERGDLLVLNGGVEAWGDKIKDLLRGSQVRVVVAGEGLFEQKLAGKGKGSLDPHVWLSPPLARKEVERILEGLVAVDSKNEAYYRANANGLERRLDQLDADYRVGLASCQQREMVTSHAAFGYLAKTYGLDQVAIAGLSPDVEPSAREMAEVVKVMREKGIKYIFFESLISPKIAEAIADETGATTLVLNPLEGLTDEQRQAGKNYLTVMRENLANLRLALGCDRDGNM